ncbi:MAG: ribbon-helix-helix domain-containing protein, partial [Pseudomonadales bacterium]
LLHHAYFEGRPMARQSISFTPPNDEWLKAQVDSEEYTSKSEVVNDLIRKAREIEFIRAKLIRAEQGGFTDLNAAEILAKSKEELRRNGEL